MRHLLFVYNADAGLGNSLVDALHKLLSPSTYPCSLCGLTHGATSMRPEWKTFLQSLPVPTRFMYRNQFRTEYPQLSTYPLPAVFAEQNDGTFKPFLTAAELTQTDLSGLIDLIRNRLSAAPWALPEAASTAQIKSSF
jgi:hypothetical protein